MEAKEETLDPTDWKKMEELGVTMVKEMMQFLSTVRNRKVWQEPTIAVKDFFKQAIPTDGQSHTDIYDDFKTKILPFPTGNIHPRFWGWVMGTGTPFAMLGDMLAAGININQGGGNQVGGLVELQLINWFKGLFQFPEDAAELSSNCIWAAEKMPTDLFNGCRASTNPPDHFQFGRC